jgi:hypothetical protein
MTYHRKIRVFQLQTTLKSVIYVIETFRFFLLTAETYGNSCRYCSQCTDIGLQWNALKLSGTQVPQVHQKLKVYFTKHPCKGSIYRCARKHMKYVLSSPIPPNQPEVRKLYVLLDRSLHCCHTRLTLRLTQNCFLVFFFSESAWEGTIMWENLTLKILPHFLKQ